MPYAIGRTRTGLYEVVAVESRERAIVSVDLVIHEGHAEIFDYMDQAHERCKAMNKERLKRAKEAKRSQMLLPFEVA